VATRRGLISIASCERHVRKESSEQSQSRRSHTSPSSRRMVLVKVGRTPMMDQWDRHMQRSAWFSRPTVLVHDSLSSHAMPLSILHQEPLYLTQQAQQRSWTASY
jgi:hypothetical protein